MTHDIDEARPMNPGRLEAERDAALARAEQAEARVAGLEAELAWVEEYGTESLNALPDCLMKLAPALVEIDRLKARVAELEAALIETAKGLAGEIRRADAAEARAERAEARVAEMEVQIREDALQYLSDTGQMCDKIDDLTRRHQHALDKIDVLENEIDQLKEATRKSLAVYERERERFRHAKPEMTGDFFIAGKHGPRDDNMMPQFIEICPAYGVGWVMIYENTGRVILQEGS